MLFLIILLSCLSLNMYLNLIYTVKQANFNCVKNGKTLCIISDNHILPLIEDYLNGITFYYQNVIFVTFKRQFFNRYKLLNHLKGLPSDSIFLFVHKIKIPLPHLNQLSDVFFLNTEQLSIPKWLDYVKRLKIKP